MSKNPYRLPRHIVPNRYELRLELDLEALTFTGMTKIEVEVIEPIDALVLNAAELEIETVGFGGEKGEIGVTDVTYDQEYERASLHLAGKASPGFYAVEIAYTGTINDQLRGLYRSVYTDAEGNDHTIATSQCQATDARRVLPCWDEPDFKAIFKTTIVAPPGLEAYSNGKELSRRVLVDGRVEFDFAETMKMSTYLLAFIVGPFEATDPVDIRGVPTRIIVPRGNLALTEYALDAAVWCLNYFSDYYDIPYPGDKLDHIALPDFPAGAMENLGLIAYRDQYLIIESERATQAELEMSLQVIAHEIAHQWFGNLVTLRWWEGAWLNEAFATFMEEKAVDVRRPEWNRWLSFQVGAKAWAHGTDHLASTRPIEFEVQSPVEVDGMFDSITYGKGSAVLRQIEQFIGEDAFRKGVGSYLRTHAYSNAETSDLWKSLNGASQWPVGAIMNTWVYQKGLPQIDAAMKADGIRLSQRRFLVIPDETDTTTWQVPLIIRGLAQGAAFERKFLLAEAEATVEIGGDIDLVLVNAGGHGFYRTRYSDEMAQELLHHFDQLEPIERHTLVDDAKALMQSGQFPASSYLDLIQGYQGEEEWAVWAEILGGLEDVRHHSLSGEAKPAFEKFVAHLIGPALERLGWEARTEDSDLARKLRGSLIGAMGGLANDPATIESSRSQVLNLIAGNDVDPEIATSALGVVAKHADRSDFDTLWQAYGEAATSADKVRYLRAVARVNLVETADLMLDRIVSGEVRSQDASLVLVLMMMTDVSDETWKVLRSRWTDVIKTIPRSARKWALSGLPALSRPETAADVKAFFSEIGFPEATRYLEQRLELLDANVAMRRRETPVVNEYFRKAASPPK